MRKLTHDFVHLISPPVESAVEIEALYRDLEERFPRCVLPDGLVYPVCEKKKIGDRLTYLEKCLRNGNGASIGNDPSIGNASLDVYFGFKNVEYPLGKTEIRYCKLMLGIKRSTVSLTEHDWLELVASMCARFNAYWGLFSPGDDYHYRISPLLERWLFFKDGYRERNKETVKEIRRLLDEYGELERLPRLDLAGYYSTTTRFGVHDVRIVPEIGWINYWCKSIAEYNEAEAVLPRLAQCGCDGSFEKTESGAYIWSLTSEPLCIDNAAHRNCLIGAYEVFPNAGLRSEQ